MAPRSVRQYELLRPIGRGGMATVYLARQRDLDRYVALKELAVFEDLDRVAARRFLREARLAGSLNHPNIVTVYDYFEDGGTPYIAMEYVQGGSLRPHVGHTSVTQTAGVMEGILAGLDHAEHHRVVHRDMKPENVLVTPEGRVKIADFGIAKATWTLQPGGDITSTGMTLGSPNYMSPEQAMAQRLGPWTDLYSLGVMAWEMLVGYAPFRDSDTPVAIVMRHINDQIPPVTSLVPDVDPGISDWVAWLVQKEPADRPQSAAEAWDALEDRVVGVAGPNWRRGAALPLLAVPEMPLVGAEATAGTGSYRTPATSALPAGAAAAGLGATVAPTHRLADGPAAPTLAQAGRRVSTGAKLGLILLVLLAIVVLATAGGGGGGGGGAAQSTPADTATTPSTSGAAADSTSTTPQSTTPQSTTPQSTTPPATSGGGSTTTPPASPDYGVGDSQSDDPSDDQPEN